MYSFFLRFRFGDRKEILRDRLEEFERPFSIDVISGHYILRDRWRNLRDRLVPQNTLKKRCICTSNYLMILHATPQAAAFTRIIYLICLCFFYYTIFWFKQHRDLQPLFIW